MTILLHTFTEILSPMMARMAFSASCRVCAMTTPLPRARPAALTTAGMGMVSAKHKALYHIAEHPIGRWEYYIFPMRFLGKHLTAFDMAAFALGPKQGIPASFRESTAPNQRSSGATTANQWRYPAKLNVARMFLGRCPRRRRLLRSAVAGYGEKGGNLF